MTRKHGAPWAGQFNADNLAKVLAEGDLKFHAEQDAKNIEDFYRTSEGDGNMNNNTTWGYMPTKRPAPSKLPVGAKWCLAVVFFIFCLSWTIAAPAPAWVEMPTPCTTKDC